MGKPYAQELERLSEAYAWAARTPVYALSNFVKLSADSPMYAVGSGGSFSAAVFASMLHQQLGSMAKPLTPLEFLKYENLNKSYSVLLVAAGGDDPDILASFERSLNRSKNLAVVSASAYAKLTLRALKVKSAFVHSEDLPTKKDGFLETNSLIAAMIWLFRSYAESNSLPFELPFFNDLAFGGLPQQKFAKELSCRLEQLAGKRTILCLYDNWGKPAAVDAESKMSEAGLANVQLADYRSFAHGRHNWIDKNKDETGIVAFVTPECRSLAEKTLSLIPKYVPAASISTEFDGPVASIGLLIQSLFMIKFFGDARGIDPGRPGPPAFGRKLYRLSVPGVMFAPMTNFGMLALRRKFGNAMCGFDANPTYKYLEKFTNKMSKAKFGAVIFDYDGTLSDYYSSHDGMSKKVQAGLNRLLERNILVGVAADGGESVRQELEAVIRTSLRPRLFIGYYNCTEIGSMEDEGIPNADPPQDPGMLSIANFLKKRSIISEKDHVVLRPSQITIEPEKHDLMELTDLIQNTDRAKRENLRAVETGYSVDVLSKEASKLNLYKFLKKRISPTREVLCIGDRGKQPGNDFELLSSPFSLSVGAASLSKDTCWNLLPAGSGGEAGAAYYMSYFNIKKGYFEFDAPRLKRRIMGQLWG